MDMTFNESELRFRDELRAWLAANPAGPEPSGLDEEFAWKRDWQRRLHADGWAGVDWPVAYGGRGASLSETAIFYEELGRAGAPLPVNIFGLLLGGPTLMVWGTQEQKDRFLAPILSADEIWCQGFSEPQAGSDLASLKTRATKDGDEWVVTGQKVWTSYAQYASWCMLLARTDTDVERPGKHQGLTYFLMDMHQEAVQVRPLRQITGDCEFNELFIDEARIPDANVIGGVGNGWKVALTTLMNERAAIGFFLEVRLRQALDDLIDEAAAHGALDDPRIADQLADLYVRTEILRLMSWRGLGAIQRHGQPGPEGSLTKWLWSETAQMLAQVAVDVVGPDALASGSRWGFELLRAPGFSIAGGTTEVLKNIVAERMLGLPRMR